MRTLLLACRGVMVTLIRRAFLGRLLFPAEFPQLQLLLARVSRVSIGLFTQLPEKPVASLHYCADTAHHPDVLDHRPELGVGVLRSPLWSSRIVPSERGPVTGRTRAAGGGFRPARGLLTRRACARGRGRARSPRGQKRGRPQRGGRISRRS